MESEIEFRPKCAKAIGAVATSWRKNFFENFGKSCKPLEIADGTRSAGQLNENSRALSIIVSL
ncbi:MAG TPA: hypothetical protein VFV23_13280 [Verrucomicrobiae bacterium]|nr:hypothetical protein [Verrucomicrobiae bacterium]